MPTDHYRAAGVNIDEGNRAVSLMKAAVRSTYTPEVLADVGAFGGLFALENLPLGDTFRTQGLEALGKVLMSVAIPLGASILFAARVGAGAAARFGHWSHSRQVDALGMQRLGERPERRLVRTGDEDVERRRPQARRGDVSSAVHDPQVERGVDGRLIAEHARDAQDQVVPRLVGEEQRVRCREEVLRSGDALDVHEAILYFIGNA